MPTENHSSRKLAAIMFVDIVGYTALMQSDEKKASTLLDKFLKTIKDQVSNNNGKVVNNYGDGCVCTFDSAVDSIYCAKELQSIFSSTPKVPVRIGLHSGDVVYKEDNVFGDSVNLASRIESMGVPGSILFSKRIRDVIKNQSELIIKPLGSFEFKNVEESIEVFALANEGLTIPKKEEINGKFKTSKKSSKPFIIASLLGLVVLSVIGITLWRQYDQSAQEISIAGDSLLESPNTPLPEEVRQKKVAVMVFENQTNSEELDPLGLMANDWITRGLLEVNQGKVINAANVRNNIALASLSGGANPEFAKATGADILIQGRYYLAEDQIIIYSDIIDAYKGTIIHGLEPIKGDANSALQLIEELTQKLIGYWATAGMNRYAQKVPNYESYKLMLLASEYWVSDPDKVEALLLQSFEADTTHFAPLARLCTHYSNSGRYEQIDSLVTFLEKRRDDLTTWENLQLNRDKARLNFNSEEELKYALQQLEIDSTINKHNIAIILHGENRLEEALAIYKDQFEKNPPGKTERSQYSLSKIVSILARLERYEELLRIIDELEYPPKHGLVLWAQFDALFHLKKWNEIDDKLKYYEQLSGPQGVFQSYLALLSTLYINKSRQFEKYGDQAKQHNLDIPLPYQILWLRGQLKFLLGDYEPSLEDYKNTRSVTKFDLTQLAVMHYAGYTDQAKALEQDYLQQKVSYDQPYYYYALGQYYIAQGNQEKSTEYLKKAVDSGMRFLPETFKNDPFLRDLIGYAPYEDLVKPK